MNRKSVYLKESEGMEHRLHLCRDLTRTKVHVVFHSDSSVDKIWLIFIPLLPTTRRLATLRTSTRIISSAGISYPCNNLIFIPPNNYCRMARNRFLLTLLFILLVQMAQCDAGIPE